LEPMPPAHPVPVSLVNATPKIASGERLSPLSVLVVADDIQRASDHLIQAGHG